MTDKKFKISVIRTEYFTNFEKKTVTCKLHYRIKATDYRMMYALNWIGSFVDSDMYADGTFTVVATAKTSPDDTFDQRGLADIIADFACQRIRLPFPYVHRMTVFKILLRSIERIFFSNF